MSQTRGEITMKAFFFSSSSLHSSFSSLGEAILLFLFPPRISKKKKKEKEKLPADPIPEKERKKIKKQDKNSLSLCSISLLSKRKKSFFFLVKVFVGVVFLPSSPTSKGGMQKWEAQSERVHVARTLLFFWHVSAPTCMLGRCLPTKISGIGAQEAVY